MHLPSCGSLYLLCFLPPISTSCFIPYRGKRKKRLLLHRMQAQRGGAHHTAPRGCVIVLSNSCRCQFPRIVFAFYRAMENDHERRLVGELVAKRLAIQAKPLALHFLRLMICSLDLEAITGTAIVGSCASHGPLSAHLATKPEQGRIGQNPQLWPRTLWPCVGNVSGMIIWSIGPAQGSTLPNYQPAQAFKSLS